MLDSAGVHRVVDAVNSKLVLVLGNFAPTEKPVLDALCGTLKSAGYVAVMFDFERPAPVGVRRRRARPVSSDTACCIPSGTEVGCGSGAVRRH